MTWALNADVLARTMWGEARGEGLLGMGAVGCVVLNRAKEPGWWGHDIASVCHAPEQFSCWNTHDPNHALLMSVTRATSSFAQACAIAEQILAGRYSDITHGADSYANLSISHPAWAAHARETVRIGHHTFFQLEKPSQPIVHVQSKPALDSTGALNDAEVVKHEATS